MTPTTDAAAPLRDLSAALPEGWSAGTPAEDDSTLIVAKFGGLAP